jgi:hypothetical protein
MATWTSEDTFKIFLLSLFVGAFVLAIKALLNAERQLNDNAKKRMKNE